MALLRRVLALSVALRAIDDTTVSRELCDASHPCDFDSVQLLQTSIRVDTSNSTPDKFATPRAAVREAGVGPAAEPALAPSPASGHKEASVSRHASIGEAPLSLPAGAPSALTLALEKQRGDLDPRLVHGLLEVKQPAATTTTTYTSWFTRLQDSLVNFICGPFVLAFSISLMWLNEQRNAKMESLISKGSADVITVSSAKKAEDNRGRLVHLNDGRTRSVGVLRDDRFDLEMSSVLRLQTTVEVYQWVEKSSSSSRKDMIGGGKTTTTTTSYSKQWSTSRNDSSKFNTQSSRGGKGSWSRWKGGSSGKGGQGGSSSAGYGSAGEERYENSFIAGSPGVSTRTSARVEYGEGFLLPKELVEQFQKFVDASSRIRSQEVSWGGKVFRKGRDGYFYWRGGEIGYTGGGEPKIGDYRASFKCVDDGGKASVLALQVKGEVKGEVLRDTFLPYRPIARRCCGWTDDMEKQALVEEAGKSAQDLYDEDQCCWGRCAYLCCCCNLVNMGFKTLLTNQIFSAFAGECSTEDCFRTVTGSNTMISWIVRLVAWVTMSVAFGMILSPLTTLLDIIPLIGWLGNMAIGIVSFVMVLFMTIAIMGSAYLIYHPSIGIIYMGILVAIIVVFSLLNQSVAGDVDVAAGVVNARLAQLRLLKHAAIS